MTATTDLSLTAAERDLAERLFQEVAALGPDTNGVSRPAWSATETAALDHLSELARAEGLAVWADALDNRWFSLPEDRGAAPYSLIGSHVDTVPDGGNYDGLAGVIAGLICLIHMRRAGRRFARAVRVLAMRGEESAWFGPCYTASKGLTGRLSAGDLASPHKGDGRSLAAHMEALGIDTAPLHAGQPLIALDEIAEYIEAHIEQGPLLTGAGQPVAVVTGIRGNLRLREIVARGEAGHSGAVPRAYRHDPVMAAARLLARMEDRWIEAEAAGADLVMTTGMIGTDPAHHAMARIPGSLRFSFEIRSQSPETLERMEAALQDEIAALSEERGVRFDLPGPIRNAPATLPAGLAAAMSRAMERAGLEPFRMPSGGGHDAAIFAQAGVPAGMLFIRSTGGSHNPAEAMEIDDLADTVQVLLAHLSP